MAKEAEEVGASFFFMKMKSVGLREYKCKFKSNIVQREDKIE